MEDNINDYSKEELLNWFMINNKSGYKSNEKWLKNHQPKLYEKIIENNNDTNLAFMGKIFLYLKNQKEVPKCPVCNNDCGFNLKLIKGFKKYCSKKCSFKIIREFNKDNVKNIQSFKDSIFIDNKSGLKSTEQYIQQSHPLEYNEIIAYPLNISNNISWSEKLYNYIHKLESTHKCLNCGNDVKYISLKNGYRKYCSLNCSGIHTQPKIKNTNLMRYGVENTFESDIIKKKIKETLLKKYNVEYLHQNKEIAKKAQNTRIERYGEIWMKLIPKHNPKSIIFLDMISEIIGLPIQHALNGGEKNFIKYWVDGYIREFNICIEWDEDKHKMKKQKEKDINRENFLRENFNCKIVRINEKEFLKNIEIGILSVCDIIREYMR